MECAIASEWIIDEKELREVGEDGWIDGPIIQTTIPDVQFNVTAFPNDNLDDVQNKVAFFLYVSTKMTVNAKYTFAIPSANFSQTLTYSFKHNECCNDDGHGEHAFSRDFLFDPKNGFFQNGKLTLQLRGTFKCDKLNEIKLGKTVGQIFWEKGDKDFAIEADGKVITAHKFILRERSPYFAAMFDSGMTEARESKVKIEGFPFNTVREAIKICYDCENKNDFSYDEYLLLLKFSDVYDIGHVKTYVESYFADIISPMNVCRIANAAIEFNAEKLRLCCLKFLVKCMKDDSVVADFESLDVNFKAEIATKAICHKN